MKLLQRKAIPWFGLAAVVLLGGAVATAKLALRPGRHAAPPDDGAPAPSHTVRAAADQADSQEADDTGEPRAIPVRTVHPRLDPSFAITVQELANVEPYFRADLRARVAGPIKF